MFRLQGEGANQTSKPVLLNLLTIFEPDNVEKKGVGFSILRLKATMGEGDSKISQICRSNLWMAPNEIGVPKKLG